MKKFVILMSVVLGGAYGHLTPELAAKKFAMREALHFGEISICDYFLQLGYAFLEQGDYNLANIHFIQSNYRCDDKLLTAGFVVKTDILAGDFTSAHAHLNEFLKTSIVDSNFAGHYRVAIEKGLSILGARPVDKTSQYSVNESLAVKLSLFSGAGQIYLGNYKKGFHHFILHTVLGGLMVWRGLEIIQGSTRANRIAASIDLGIISSLIFPRYYRGSRHLTRQAARDRNLRGVRDYLYQFKREILLNTVRPPLREKI